MILETRAVPWPDEAACGRSARRLASRPGIREAFIELRGPLGAGKTTFVRHLLHALGVEGRIKSPTYAVMEPYTLPGHERDGAPTTEAWHFDFYRFNDPREWEDAGFRDIFASSGLKLTEWPEQAAGLLPTPDLRIDIAPVSSMPAEQPAADQALEDAAGDASEPLPDRRIATFSAMSALGLELLP